MCVLGERVHGEGEQAQRVEETEDSPGGVELFEVLQTGEHLRIGTSSSLP